MGKRNRLTYIEILLILAIIAILVVWLFPRFLKMLDSNSAEVGNLRLLPGPSHIEKYCLTSDLNFRATELSRKNFSGSSDIKGT
jgi:hypothetical protein